MYTDVIILCSMLTIKGKKGESDEGHKHNLSLLDVPKMYRLTALGRRRADCRKNRMIFVVIFSPSYNFCSFCNDQHRLSIYQQRTSHFNLPLLFLRNPWSRSVREQKGTLFFQVFLYCESFQSIRSWSVQEEQLLFW